MELVEVTVYYLEMLAPSHRTVPAPRDGLSVVHVPSPTVPDYRSLYDAVGKEFHWLSRRKMSDEALAAVREAEAIFAAQRARGATAFKVEPGEAPVRIEKFDQTAEQIIMVPRVVGG